MIYVEATTNDIVHIFYLYEDDVINLSSEFIFHERHVEYVVGSSLHIYHSGGLKHEKVHSLAHYDVEVNANHNFYHYEDIVNLSSVFIFHESKEHKRINYFYLFIVI